MPTTFSQKESAKGTVELRLSKLIISQQQIAYKYIAIHYIYKSMQLGVCDQRNTHFTEEIRFIEVYKIPLY